MVHSRGEQRILEDMFLDWLRPFGEPVFGFKCGRDRRVIRDVPKMKVGRIMSCLGKDFYLFKNPGRGRGEHPVDDMAREVRGMVVGRRWLGDLRKFI